MSFEKKMQKRGNDKLNQFAKNPYHQEEVVAPIPAPKKRFPVWLAAVIPSVAVATLVVILVPTMIMMGGARGAAKAPEEGQGGQDYNPGTAEGSNDKAAQSQAGNPSTPGEQGAPTPRWEEKTTLQRYPDFLYGSIQYNIRYSDRSEPISETYIKQKLDDISVRGYDIYEEEAHYINASIYTINQISDKVSLAIRFEGETAYYAYQNSNYKPQTLSDLLADTCFDTEAIISKGSYMDYVRSDYNKDYAVVDQNTIMDILYSDKSPANTNIRTAILKADNPNEQQSSSEATTQMPSVSARIDLTVGFPCLGIDNAVIYCFNNGRMDVNFFGTIATFDIGVTRYNAIKSSLEGSNN